MGQYAASDLQRPLEGASRLIKSLGTGIPAKGDLPDLLLLSGLQAEVDQALRKAVDGFRDMGYSWADIGAALGITRAAACNRFGPAAKV